MTKRSSPAATRPSRRFTLIAAAAAAGLAVGLAGIYGMAGFQRNNSGGACEKAVDLAQKLKPLARGEVAAVNVASKPLALPNLAYADAAGKIRTLTDWRGRTVLLNLWATWCVPCREEMPALDALQQKLGSASFEVVSVNIDTRNLDRPKTWLAEVGIKTLAYYADSQAKIFQDLKTIGRAFGMPTTVLIDPQGCELATIAGPADWASKDATALIEAALAPR